MDCMRWDPGSRFGVGGVWLSFSGAMGIIAGKKVTYLLTSMKY